LKINDSCLFHIALPLSRLEKIVDRLNMPSLDMIIDLSVGKSVQLTGKTILAFALLYVLMYLLWIG
jgi:hypothetical protein